MTNETPTPVPLHISIAELMSLAQVLMWLRAGLLELRQAVQDEDGMQGTAVLAIILEHPRAAADVVAAEELTDRIFAAAARGVDTAALRRQMREEMREAARERVLEYTSLTARSV
jgi:hypothetical protein